MILSTGAHTILVSEAGDLYAAGSNSCGQLGLGHEVGDCHIFCRLRDEITQNFRFSFVRCGEEFSVAISRNHSVFSCGFGIGGQLGSGCRENRNTFCLIPELESCLIETVSCSQGAVFALSRSGAVYTWGTMLHYSEFGLSVSEVAPPARPSISKIFCKRKKARHICCGRKHYLMLGVAPFGPVSYIVTNSWKGCDPTNDCARVRAGTSIRCIVQTVDNLGSHVDFGGSCIQCRATRLSASVRSKYMNPNMQVDDNLDGTYSLTIVLFSTGIYEIAFLLDELHLQESPYFVEVLPNDLGLYSCEIVEVSVSATRPKEEIVCFPFEPNSGRFSTVHIESDMISAQINDTLSVSFKLSDKYGNIIDEFGDDPQLVVKCSDHRGGDNLCREAVHCLSHAQNLRRTTLLNSHVFCLYYQLPAKAGVYDIKVMLNSSQILNWSLEIASKEVSGNMSVVLAPAEGNVDEPIIVTVLPRNNSGVKVLIDLASMIHNDEVIRSSICQLECEISARAIVHFGHLRKKCVDVAGELTLDEISGNILLSHTLRYAGLAQLIVWIGSTTVFQKKIMVNAGKPSETFSELLNPRISLAPWSPNVESCRKVLFQCRDSYGNKVVKENHQVFADLLIIQGNKCIQKQALIVSEMSSGLFLINVECDFSYASNYGFELAVNLNGKNVLYSPFLMRAESGAEHRDIAHSSVKALGELATIYSDIVLPPDSTVPLNKKKLAEITNSRAIDCLKETQRRLHEERAARKKLHTVKRTGGGFIIQYSKDI